MYRRLGYFPTESSEHSAEYLPWLMHDDDAIERYRLWVAEYVSRSEENLAEYERTRAAARPRRPLEIEPSAEYAPQIIHSIETGRPRVDLRQRPQHRPDRQPARRCLRRGAVPGRRQRRAADRTSARCRPSSRRSTAPT